MNEPTIVWADEPTGNLDTKNSIEIMELLLDLNKKNKQTFIIITHDPAVGKKCKRMLKMQSGVIDREVNNK